MNKHILSAVLLAITLPLPALAQRGGGFAARITVKLTLNDETFDECEQPFGEIRVGMQSVKDGHSFRLRPDSWELQRYAGRATVPGPTTGGGADESAWVDLPARDQGKNVLAVRGVVVGRESSLGVHPLPEAERCFEPGVYRLRIGLWVDRPQRANSDWVQFTVQPHAGNRRTFLDRDGSANEVYQQYRSALDYQPVKPHDFVVRVRLDPADADARALMEDYLEHTGGGGPHDGRGADGVPANRLPGHEGLLAAVRKRRVSDGVREACELALARQSVVDGVMMKKPADRKTCLRRALEHARTLAEPSSSALNPLRTPSTDLYLAAAQARWDAAQLLGEREEQEAVLAWLAEHYPGSWLLATLTERLDSAPLEIR